MIKAIISDLGNVVYKERWDLVLKSLKNKIDERITLEKFKQAFFRYWDEYKVGLLERNKFWSHVLNYLGLEDSEDNILEASASLFRVWETHDRPVIKILKKLKKNYLLFALTNSCCESEDRLDNDRKVSGLFRKIYMSHKQEKKKPDKEAFLSIVRENNLLPEECIFIDDQEKHAKAAQNLGLHGLQYKNPKQLKQDLKRLGLAI